MNLLTRILLPIVLVATSARIEGEILPPQRLRGEWEELRQLDFQAWRIDDFLGWDVPFDGGSKVFFLVSDQGSRFDLVMANPAYWTEQDKKKRQQVFLIRHKNRFYRIDPESDEEKNLIEMLNKGAAAIQGEGKRDPKLLTKLAERLRTREPQFKLEG